MKYNLILYHLIILNIFYLFVNNNLIYCLTNLKSFKLEWNQSFGSLNTGCEVNAGVVLQDVNSIKSFSSNVFLKYLQVEKEDLKVYYLVINSIQFGLNDKIEFNVINSLNENSTIILNQQYNCKELKSPIKYNIISKFGYLVNSFLNYDLEFDFNILEIGSSLTCNTNFGHCLMFGKIGNVVTIKVDVNLNSYISNKEFKINLVDTWNGITEIIVDTQNYLFQRDNISTTVIDNLYLNYKNDSKIYPNDIWLTMLAEFKDYNSLVYLQFNNNNYFSTVAFGTNERKTYLYRIPILQSNNIIMYDAAKQINQIGLYNFQPETYLFPTQNGIFKTTLQSYCVNYNNSNLIFKLNQFQISNLIQGYSARTNSTNDIPLPYGYSSIATTNQNKWIFSGEYLVPPFRKFGAFSLVLNGTQKTVSYRPDLNFPNIILEDSKAPSLHSVQIKLLDNNKVLTRLHITDQGSGVHIISSRSPQFQVIAFNYLTSGTLNDGIFEIISDVLYSGNKVYIELVDLFGTSNTISYYINENLDRAGYIIPNLGDISIDQFYFNRLEIDTSFDNLDLKLTIKFTDKNSLLPPPYIEIKNIGMENKIYFGKYIKENDNFEIDIKVPARESGYLQYTFNSVIFDQPATSSSLELLFPSQKVMLTTNYIDHFPPTIEEIKILDQELNETDGTVSVGWDLLIKDFPVGLDYGTFEINSDVDINPILFNIKPNQSIPGSDTLSNYKLQFKIRSSIKQTFQISKCKLVDKNGYISSYPLYEQISKVINPFIYLGGNPKYYSFTYIPSTSSSIIQDLLAPKLLTLEYPSIFNSYLPNRIMIFKFTTVDQGESGISIDHNPYIYIQNYEGYIRVQSEFIKSDQDSIHYYNATIEIPYGFLYSGAIVSVHGITDNNLNVASYLSDDLLQMGLQSSIINTSPLNIVDYPPVILEYTSITSNGGTLYLYGRNFGTSINETTVYGEFNDGSGFIKNKLIISSIENLAISITIPKLLNTTRSINIKIVKFNQLESNIISIVPIKVEEEIILDCNKLSNCNNRGICINGQCQCNKGWYGLDCSSNKTLGEIGHPDNDKPTYSFYGSIIEIKQILETDINGKAIQEFNLTTWSYRFENQSTIYPNSTSYIYQSIINNNRDGLKTKIQVVISVFNEKTNINYANQILKMDKDSIKYTISMDRYSFSSQFNTLKLIIKTSISDTNEKCSFYDYALNNNNEIEWIKIGIGNTTIMGKFIQTGIVDYRIIKVSNKLIVPPSLDKQEAIIAVSCPYYRDNILLDPDWQVLVDYQNNNNNNKSSCYLNNQIQNNNHQLTTAQLVSIITVSIFIVITIIIISALIFKKKLYFNGCKVYYISDKTITNSNLELDNKINK